MSTPPLPFDVGKLPVWDLQELGIWPYVKLNQVKRRRAKLLTAINYHENQLVMLRSKLSSLPPSKV